MALSFFSSKKPPAGQKADENSPHAPMAVRTMQDDLADIKSGKRHAASGKDEREKLPEPAFSGAAANPFIEAEERPQRSEMAAADKATNPFGVSGRVNRPLEGFSQRPTLENGLTSMVPDGALIINEPEKSKKGLIISILSVIIILFLSVAAWYLFPDALRGLLKPAPALETIGPADEVLVPSAPKPLPFSLDKPNYLPINTEVVSPDDIRKALLQAAERIREADISSPIEFLVTDQNNNPLAFSRFAFLLGLDLDPELLALIDESFALYAYDDSGRTRLGLALTLTDVPVAAAIIAKTETALPYAMRPLVLESDTVVSESLVFRSSAYDRFPVRFANIDSIRGVSLDYAIDGDRWYIGTSKDTLRSVLDMSAKQIDVVPQIPRNEAL